jgi:sugar phosphate isomerase/epimerase
LDLRAGWWPSPFDLEQIDSAGFAFLQLTAPPVRMLANPCHSVGHAKALTGALGSTDLKVALHAPTSLRLGDALNDRAFEGLLEYAAQIGAHHVTYHALDVPRRGRESAAEELSLRRLADWADVIGVMICVENLCPVYPGATGVSHDPLAVRSLVNRIDAPSMAIALDLGHANVVAEMMGTEVVALIEPVLEKVGVIHLHDNFGARNERDIDGAFDPLLLDLHLQPGKGTIPWQRVAPLLSRCDVPAIVEVDAVDRVQPDELYRAGARALDIEPRQHESLFASAA